MRVARTRQRAFLPTGLVRLEPRGGGTVAHSGSLLRGHRTWAVVRVVALVTEEPVSAATVSRVTRDLDHAVAQFHQAPLAEELVLSISGWGESASAAPAGANGSSS